MLHKICDLLGRPKVDSSGEKLSGIGRVFNGWFIDEVPEYQKLDKERMKKEGRYKGSYVTPKEHVPESTRNE